MAFTQETAALAGSKSSRKGIMNKETKVLREKIDQLLENQWDGFLADLKSLKPKERVDIIVRLLEFGLPKLQRSHIEQEVKKIEIDLSKWS